MYTILSIGSIKAHYYITKYLYWHQFTTSLVGHVVSTSEKDTHYLIVVRPAANAMNNGKWKLSLGQIFSKTLIYFILKESQFRKLNPLFRPYLLSVNMKKYLWFIECEQWWQTTPSYLFMDIYIWTNLLRI